MDAAPGSESSYPARVDARLEEPLSRWLWLVKWLLLIPHYIVLFFLWVAFFFTTVVAFFAVLFTGRYPRGLFDFNVGVLRWTWRVDYYGYNALATDRYPPFTLAEAPDYPATLEVAYPERLSRGLVLVKWWLLALPHYLILSVLVGGGAWVVSDGEGWDDAYRTSQGLLGFVVLFAAVALLFTGRYPRGLYDLATGVNRWFFRVVAYAALMTDAYPPFRLDQGGTDLAAPVPAPDGGTGAAPVAAGAAVPVPPGTARSGGGAAGPVVALVAGVLAVLLGLGLGVGGVALLWLDSRRDAAGFVSTDTGTLRTDTAAVTVEHIDVTLEPGTLRYLEESGLGRVRVRVTSIDGSPLFLGIAPAADVDSWLGGAAHDEITDIGNGRRIRLVRGGGPVTSVPPPAGLGIWTASTSGPGTQELDWTVESGRWTLVIARADGGTGIRARIAAATTVPDLTGWGAGLLGVGILLFAAGVVLIVLGAVGLGRRTRRPPPATSAVPPPTAGSPPAPLPPSY